MSYKLADGSLSTDYEIGDEFVVVGGSCDVGERINLATDDGSFCPYFSKRPSGVTCNHWEFITPTTETKRKVQARKPKPPAFIISSGDYIDSREFTREECERFCELAVECGFKKSPCFSYSYDYLGVNEESEFIDTLSKRLFVTSIATQFREFLDKGKDMKQFTKDDFKDGQRVFLEDGATTDNGLFKITSEDSFYVCGDNAIMPVLNEPSPYLVLSELDENLKTKRGQKVVRIEDRDGTILFERQPEKRKVTFELTKEQERELREQLGLGNE